VTLASLPTLVEHSSAAGLAVTVHTHGEPRPLAHAADQAAYRILQEALTNAARHGTGTAHVRVAFAAAGVDLTVTNPMTAAVATRARVGHGLIGMGERASLLGGDVDVARANGTFRVHARLPYQGRSA